MTVCKAIFSGTVFRAPEKRFTQNQVAITSFVLQVQDNDNLLIRVISMGKAAEETERVLTKSDKVVVEGRLQVGVVKDEDGNEKRVMELMLSSFEKTGGADLSDKPKKIAKFAEEDFSDDLIGEEEIPF